MNISLAQTLRAQPWLAFGMLQSILLSALLFAPTTILVRTRVLAGNGQASLALILAAEAVGAACGSVVSATWSPKRPGLVSIIGYCAFGLISCFVYFGAPLPLLAIASTLAFLLVRPRDAWWFAAISRAAPDSIRGRIHTVDLAIPGIAEPIGYAIAAWAIAALSLPVAAVFVAGAALVVGLPALLVPRFQSFGSPIREQAAQ